jgi:fused signal recognition particle receptor
MFKKLRERLKSWTKKVSETDEVPEEPIDEKIKEKVSKEKPSKKTKEKKPGKKRESEKDKKKKEKSENNEKELPEDIDEKLKKEVSKEKYKEPEKKFSIAHQDYHPDIEKETKKIKKEESEKESLKEKQPEEKNKSGFFKKIFSDKKKITEEQFENYSEDLEMILLENNVALEVAEKIISEIKEQIVNKELSKKEIEITITNTLEEKIKDILIEPFDLIKEIKEKNKKDQPYVILFCGVNGSGKTTTIAKLASFLKKEGFSIVMGAGDTFRAASIEQLKKHGEKLKIPVIAHEYNADPAAVAFDTIKYANKNKTQVVLIDTAGRMHTATNLLREMEKIKRIASPDRTIFLGESITGNDSVDQVRAFDETIGIDGIILSKADIDEKGGTALSVGYITKKPVLFLGTGQKYKDLEPFNKWKFLESLGLD